jgi:putative nucleotidyltransferase-like protein
MSSDTIVTLARELHESCRLAGSEENELLTLPDPMITWLVMVLRQRPCPAPDVSAGDWERLLEYLRSHWIGPALYWHIRQLPDACRPPDSCMHTLHHLWLDAEVQTIRAGQQIRRVVEALEAVGIPVLLLKGPALARRVYPSPAMRQGSDIDLLIHYEDMERGEAVMAALGYTCPVKTAAQSPYSAHHQNFYPGRAGEPFVIEMHWQLDCGFGLAPENLVDAVFSRSIRVASDDVTFSTLSVEDHLLYQSFHMACQHCSSTRLSWISDIALLSRQIPDIAGWEHLLSLSVERNCRLSLESAVSMARF